MPEFDVVDLEPTDHPTDGDDAPDFTRPLVTAEYWEDRALSELVAEREEPTILVFTPMVGSFLAKYVWDELAERGWDESAHVVGISAANPYGVKRFIEDNDYPFEIFADPTNEVAATYDVAHDLDGMAGVSEPRIAFFAINPDRSVEMAWVATEWPEFPEYDELEHAWR
ncbi:redoxin domain-containing protein [Natrialbaceae archaeon A-arb3/5]